MTRRAVILTNILEAKGLAVDAEILAQRLRAAGVEPVIVDFRESPASPQSMLGRGRYDLGIACEVQPTDEQRACAPRWWWKPNPEWCDAAALERASSFHRVLLKTRHAQKLHAWGGRALFVGFESPDVGEADGVATFDSSPLLVLHAVGSIARGTPAVLRAWNRVVKRGLPRPAQLVVVNPPNSMDEVQRLVVTVPHVRVERRLPLAEWRALQRRAAVHVICSEHEGWGHGFWEGLSVGARVIATDGPWWARAAGAFVPVPAARSGYRCLAERHHVDVGPLAQRLLEAVSAGPQYVAAARQTYEAARAEFREALSTLLAEVRPV